ncbi:hypothetical protein [Azohydromonas caseinilytica]|uniref:Calcineurin-like phosphoesterase domain-containing protein n=1 Tax=Azohydromonas caseinilytica TaxID=2728836 RepID=A0A848F0M7_9BURK|nr:hypothetical protein [Azohydromonas caseinilytica]NML13607.1 hypothetical protein [Azohydromonas caseinilytica]
MHHDCPESSRRSLIRAMPRRGRRLAGLLLAAAAVLGGCAQPVAAPLRQAPPQLGGFAFALMGDMPYSPREMAQVDALIQSVNADAEVGLVLHVGDVKGGGERCDEPLYRERLRQLQQVARPLLYTPGDNEWTDCHRPSNGAYVPTERLALLRRVFFPEPGRSLGREPVALRSQAQEGGAHAAFVENVMAERQGVLFATLHVVGSRNGLAPWMGVDPKDGVTGNNPERNAEFEARQAANLAWLDRLFDEAQRRNAAGVVVAMQANPRIEAEPGSLTRNGFDAVLARLHGRAQAFGRPVLLVHGDDHEFFIDQPWYRDKGEEPRLANVTRVQGYGSPRLHWVKVRVLPNTPEVFHIEPQRVRGNP